MAIFLWPMHRQKHLQIEHLWPKMPRNEQNMAHFERKRAHFEGNCAKNSQFLVDVRPYKILEISLKFDNLLSNC